MTENRIVTRRRILMAGAAVVGAVGAGGAAALVSAEPAPAPGATPAPGPAPRAARRVSQPSAYRLQPITGYGPLPDAPPRLRVRSIPLKRFSSLGRSMVLTFDDGPDPRYTPDILRVLRKHEVRAMFFVCGEMVDKNPDLVRQMADEGHVVGNHTWSHPMLPSLSRTAVRAQIERTSDAVEKACGERPQWFRAPYGAWNRAAFRIGADLGMEPLAWTLDTLDWRAPAASVITRRVREGAGPGVVVLSHDAGGNRSQSVKALRTYLPALLEEGYRITVPSRMRTA